QARADGQLSDIGVQQINMKFPGCSCQTAGVRGNLDRQFNDPAGSQSLCIGGDRIASQTSSTHDKCISRIDDSDGPTVPAAYALECLLGKPTNEDETVAR